MVCVRIRAGSPSRSRTAPSTTPTRCRRPTRSSRRTSTSWKSGFRSPHRSSSSRGERTSTRTDNHRRRRCGEDQSGTVPGPGAPECTGEYGVDVRMERFEMREARVGGYPTRWRVAGDGPPLVLVHGLSASSRWWSAVLPPLAEVYSCHLVDVPRFGAALRPDETAEWLGTWMDAAGLRRVRLAGHSMGAAAAARFAALRPELVEALVLVSPIGMPSKRRVTGYALPLLGALRMTTPRFLAALCVDALRTGPAAIVRGGLYAARADLREQA